MGLVGGHYSALLYCGADLYSALLSYCVDNDCACLGCDNDHAVCTFQTICTLYEVFVPSPLHLFYNYVLLGFRGDLGVCTCRVHFAIGYPLLNEF